METAVQKSDLFRQALEKAKRENVNLLMPTIHMEGLSEFHAPVLESVTLSADPKDGDVYPHDEEKDPAKKKYRPTKQALMKLSVCGGVIWSVSGCKRVDDMSNRDYICYQAVGGIRKADGQPVFFKAVYDMDFEVIEADLREQYEKKAKWLKKGEGQDKRSATDEEKREYVEYCVKRDLLQKRRHALKLCEAGAMNRVIRELFSLKQAYSSAELAKPFMMARIIFRPDYSAPDVRKAMIDAHVKAMTGIYGDVTERTTEDQVACAIDVTPRKEEDDDQPGNGSAPQPPPDDQAQEEKPPTTEAMLADYMASERAEKERAVSAMAKKKGYDLNAWMGRAKLKAVAEIEPGKLLDLFKHLLSLPDKANTDVPF